MSTAVMATLVAAGIAVAVRQPIAPSSPIAQSAPRLTDTPQPTVSAASPSNAATPATATPSVGATGVSSAETSAKTPTTSSAEPSTTPTRPPVPPTQPSVAPSPVASKPAIASGEACRPVRFAMAGLGIDASVVTLSVTAEGDLGTPSDGERASAGWFPSVLAGADRGTVLMDGHTYHDGSAIFSTSFKDQVRTGMVMRLSCPDGHAFSYRVSEVIVDVSPADYPSLVTGRNLYAPAGPPQLVMITCTDYIPAQRVWAHRAVVIATPIA